MRTSKRHRFVILLALIALATAMGATVQAMTSPRHAGDARSALVIAPSPMLTGAQLRASVLPVAAPSKAPTVVISDPSGDNFNPAADVTDISAEISGSNITFTIDFATLVVVDAYAALNLDTDQNQGTGRFPPSNGSASQTVGVEYELFLDIYNSNAQPTPLCLVLDGPTRSFLSSTTLSIVGNTVSFTLPLSDLGNDDGNMNMALGAVNGTAGLFADLAPDSGHGTFTTGGDTTPPEVSSSAPSNGEVNVVRDIVPRISFTEALDPLTVSGSTVTLMQGVTPVAGTLALESGNTVVSFTPSTDLAASTGYTLTATTGITDVAGNALDGDGGGGDFVSSFTTGTDFGLPVVATDASGDAGGAHDIVSLRIGETLTEMTFRLDFSSFNAADAWGSINLDVDQNTGTGSFPPQTALPAHDIGADYELWMDINNLNSRPIPAAFLMDSTRAFLGPEYSMTITGSSVEFTIPLSDIGEAADGNMDLTTHVVTAATSIFSDHLPDGGHISYVATIDRVPPIVQSVNPANGTQNVPVGTTVDVVFDEAIDPATVTGATVFLFDTLAAANVPATLSLSGDQRTVTITPSAALDDSVQHEVHATTGITDTSGNALVAEFISSFRTADITQPTVQSTFPPNGSTGVTTSTAVVINFSEAVGEVDRDNITFTGGGLTIAADYSLLPGEDVAVVAPLLPLVGNTTYTVQALTTVLDLNGNALDGDGIGGPLVFSFTTADVGPADTIQLADVTIPVWQRQVTVPVDLSNSFDVGGLNFSVSFDSSVLSYAGHNTTSRSAGMELISASESTPGLLSVTMLAQLAGSGTALTAGTGSIIELVLDVDTAQPYAAPHDLSLMVAALSETRGLAFATPGMVDGSVIRDPALGGDAIAHAAIARLGLPHPNPFNPRVVIPVSLPTATTLSLRVHDARGQLVRVLHEGAMPAGDHDLVWTGVDLRGRPVSSGVYHIRLQSPTGEEVAKVGLVR